MKDDDDDFPEADAIAGAKKLERFKDQMDAFSKALKKADIDHHFFIAVKPKKDSGGADEILGQAAMGCSYMCLSSVLAHIFLMAKDKAYLLGGVLAVLMVKSGKFDFKTHDMNKKKDGMFSKMKRAFHKEDDDE